MNTDGIILINKEKGWTSHDVVAKVRGILKKQAGRKVKVGHTGTLDPLATGLMILVIGSYCERASEFSKLDKVYEVTMKLGESSTTGDAEGQITKTSNKKPSQISIKKAIANFMPKYMQTPPVFSAVKVGGRRAYKLARANQPVIIEPRLVKIYDIQITSYIYPVLKFTAKVSSGTYIRSLVEDIGARLGSGGYMSDLKRIKVGAFSLKNAASPNSLKPDEISPLHNDH